jgi:hypothetical protein
MTREPSGIEGTLVILSLFAAYFAFIGFVAYVMPWGLGN